MSGEQSLFLRELRDQVGAEWPKRGPASEVSPA